MIDFFSSLLRGYPVGMLLLSEQSAEAETLALGPVVVDAPAREHALWIIDGLQRVTALVGSLAPTTDGSDPRFEVGVDLDTRQVSEASETAPASWLPLRTLFNSGRRFDWVRENTGWLLDRHHEAIEELASTLADAPFPAHLIDPAGQGYNVEIFRRINTSSRSLTDQDLARASSPASDTAFDRAGFGRVSAQRLQAVRRTVQAVAAADGPSPQQVLFQVATTLRRDVHIPHLRLLPHDSMLLVLAAFVAKFGQPEERTAELFRRWVWRMAILEPAPPPDASLSRVSTATSPGDAVLGLLEAAPAAMGDWVPDLDHHAEWQASDRLNALGLWSAGPRHLDENHAPLSAAEIFDSGEPLHELMGVPGWPGALLHRPTDRRAFHLADQETLASHLIDATARELLLDNDYDGFGAHRAELLSQAVLATVDRNAEWGARDSFSARSLLGKAAHDA
ncbi:hypothetical protein JOM49_000785 [Amycolatopsis magusensis]|uniref:GmrSD restriction endonucleases N-terminal domain-containing protein n=1 Tax=Amycolatopsis magusensis TaxID=882444 RepID=A0ABS4PK94_9PSEU|nr:hypothetical protein [Amycolatopsis magusensis]